MSASYAPRLPAKRTRDAEPEELPAEAAVQFDALTRLELACDAACTELSKTEFISQRQLQNAQTATRDLLKRCVAALSRISELSDTFPPTPALQTELARHASIHTSLQSQIRTATLAAASALRAREENERTALLSGSLTHAQLRARHQTSDPVLEASTRLTDSMRDAVSMLATELERSHHANTALVSSTETMSRTKDEYKSYSVVIKGARGLVDRIASRDWTDRLLIGFGVLVFLLTVVYSGLEAGDSRRRFVGFHR